MPANRRLSLKYGFARDIKAGSGPAAGILSGNARAFILKGKRTSGADCRHLPETREGGDNISIELRELQLKHLSATNPGCDETKLVSIVDDNDYCREGINAFIKSCGYKCATFRSAEEYLLPDAARITACLVVDVQLPGIKGPDLQDRLIADGYRMPIIFVTGFFDERTKNRVLQAGALGYLSKPCCGKTLSGCLEKALGGVIGDEGRRLSQGGRYVRWPNQVRDFGENRQVRACATCRSSRPPVLGSL